MKDDFILFGDLMNSLTVLRYNNDEEKFEEVKISTRKKKCSFFFNHNLYLDRT